MGNLPKVTLPTKTIDIGSSPLVLRALSRAEIFKAQALTDAADAEGLEIYLIACATDNTIEAVTKWRKTIDPQTGQLVQNAILELIGESKSK